MKKKIEIAYASSDETMIEKAVELLKKNGFEAILLKKKPDFNSLIAIAMTPSTKRSELLKDNEWIKKELKRSDIKTLRAMPLVIYSSKEETLEMIWEKNVGKIYESLFSDEFKPFGLDLAGSESQFKELNQLIEKYYAK